MPRFQLTLLRKNLGLLFVHAADSGQRVLLVVHGGVLHALHIHATGGRAFSGSLLNASLSSVAVECPKFGTSSVGSSQESSQKGSHDASRSAVGLGGLDQLHLPSEAAPDTSSASETSTQLSDSAAAHWRAGGQGGGARRAPERISGGICRWVLLSWNSVDHLSTVLEDGRVHESQAGKGIREGLQPAGAPASGEFGGGDIGG